MSVLFVSGAPMDTWSSTDLDNFRQLPRDRVDFMEKPFWPMAFLGKIGELIRGVVNIRHIGLNPRFTHE
jgi:hypothetical protein